MGTVLRTESTLGSKKQQLDRENSILDYLVYVELLAGGLLLLYGIYTYLQSNSTGWIIAGGIVLFLGSAHLVRKRRNRDTLGKIQSGRSGEAFVSGLLADELPDDHYILNDVEVTAGSNSAQNDHIVLSRGGIFLVETKAYSGRLSGSADAERWSQERARGRTQALTNPIEQSRYHARVLEEFLAARTVPYEKDDIHCYVAMVNKDCDWEINGDDSMVDYAWNIPDRIRQQSRSNRYDNGTLRSLLEELNVEVPDELE